MMKKSIGSRVVAHFGEILWLVLVFATVLAPVFIFSCSNSKQETTARQGEINAARRKIGSVVYVKDTEAGVCFAVSTTRYGASTSGIGIAHVPCREIGDKVWDDIP